MLVNSKRKDKSLQATADDILGIVLEAFLAAETINDPQRKPHFAASRLYQSFDTQILNDRITVFANDYWKSIDAGQRSGTLVPIDKLLDWATYYRIVPPGEAVDFAYSVQNAIFAAGVRPRPFAEQALENAIRQLTSNIDKDISLLIIDAVSSLFELN